MNEQAIEAVADAIRAIDGPATLGGSDVAAGVLAFIRDAIHRDGDDADAVREALGLRVVTHHLDVFVRSEHPRTRVVGEWQVTGDTDSERKRVRG